MEQKSQSYFSSGLADEIIVQCRKLIKDSPNNPRLHQTMGAAYEIKGDFLSATDAFEFVTLLEPNNVANMISVGRCIFKLQNYKRALEIFKLAVQHHPEWPDTHHWLGRTFFESHQFDDAKIHLEMAVSINPNYHEAYYCLALTCEALGDLAQTIINFKKVIDLIPKPWGLSPFPYDFQALIDIVFPDDILLDEFIRQARQLTNSPGSAGFADLHFKLGMAYRSKGLISEALAEFRQTILINPDFHLARHYFWNLEEERRKVVRLS
ncbi:MAG: tetratricopeptide repeat protein [Candidatus Ozemobacteraceae bacterium]